MVTQQLLDFISSQKKSGITEDIIRTTLLNSKWPELDINQAFQQLQQNIPLAPETTIVPSPEQKDSKVKTILIIIVLFLFYPLGLILMWLLTHWPKWVKWLLTALIIVPIILGTLATVVLVAINPAEKIHRAECTKQCQKNSQEINNCKISCIENKPGADCTKECGENSQNESSCINACMKTKP